MYAGLALAVKAITGNLYAQQRRVENAKQRTDERLAELREDNWEIRQWNLNAERDRARQVDSQLQLEESNRLEQLRLFGEEEKAFVAESELIKVSNNDKYVTEVAEVDKFEQNTNIVLQIRRTELDRKIMQLEDNCENSLAKDRSQMIHAEFELSMENAEREIKGANVSLRMNKARNDARESVGHYKKKLQYEERKLLKREIKMLKKMQKRSLEKATSSSKTNEEENKGGMDNGKYAK